MPEERNFALRERLGEGGFGVVYRARQEHLDRDVAVKTIHPALAATDGFAARFDDEARVVARLEHPHIVPLYEYGRDEEGAWLIMRLLPGGSLADALAKGPWNPLAAATLLEEVAAGLALAHRHGVIHRDVKPANILLDRAGGAYLTDFGIALDAFADAAADTAGPGSPAYMAPEQLAGGQITEKTDVYSLGVVMHEVLTGELSWKAATLQDTIMRRLAGPLPDVHTVRGELSPQLSAAVAAAMAQDPAARPTLGEFTEAFSSAARAGTTAADLSRNNMPDYLTSFVGRSSELDEIATLVGANRLTVLTGVGGTGKTRLAIEAARAAVNRFPEGAWLVELAPVTNPQLIMTEIGDTWGLRPGEGAAIEDVVTRYLWSKELLLVVDNCEHVLDGAVAAIRRILNSCPNVRIVATSRESLGIPGEGTLRVPSLGLPDADHEPAESEAAMLFLDRARSARTDFDPNDEEMAAVGRIVTRIDGIPLGLELAAARLRSMSAEELADRLEDSFRILSGSAKTALPRQRTLHATIEWSHDLLKPEERALFRRLAVFAGGFDLAAAEAVGAAEDIAEWEILDHLDSLVDKSLVVPSHDPAHGTRYRLLEPVRQFAQEVLARSGEAAATQRAHADRYVAFVSEASPHTRGPDQMEWERRLDVEYDNIRAAFATLLENDAIEPYLDMALDLQMYWVHTGLQLEGIDVLVNALEASHDGTDELRRIRGWSNAAIMAAEITNPRAVGFARTGLAMARATGDANTIGRLEMALGAAIRHTSSDPEYLEHLHEARRLLDEHPEPHWSEPEWERALHNLIFAAYLPPDDERIREHLDTAIELFEKLGDRAMLAATLNESTGLLGRGDDEWIMANQRRAIEIFESIHVPYWHAHALMYYGIVLQMHGDERASVPFLAEGAGLLEDCGDISCWATSSRYLATAESALGQHGSAKQRLAAVIEQLPVLPMPEITKPRSLDGAAEILLAAGAHSQAAVVLGRAMAVEYPPTVFDRDASHQAVRDGVVEHLGEDAAAGFLAEGEALATDEALGKALAWLQEG